MTNTSQINIQEVYQYPLTIPPAVESNQALPLGQATSLFQSSQLSVSSTTVSGDITVPASQLVGGYFVDSGSQSQLFYVTTDNATNILAALLYPAVGTSFVWRFINNDQSSSGHDGKVMGGSNVTVETLLPDDAVGQGHYADYLFTVTSLSPPHVSVTAVGGTASAIL